MSLFVIADLHLAHTMNKPMDIFGKRWENHTQRIYDNWKSVVSPEDTVVIAGDVSWGMRIEEAEADFRFLESLPGHKIVLKGNHDYWWQTMKKLTEFRDRVGAFSVDFLFNNAYETEEFILCGTRGWTCEEELSAEDKKLIERENLRLRLSLDMAKKIKTEHPDAEIIPFLHFPPATPFATQENIMDTLLQYGVQRVYYGHLHGIFGENKICRTKYGILLYLVSGDYLEFKPLKID